MQAVGVFLCVCAMNLNLEAATYTAPKKAQAGVLIFEHIKNGPQDKFKVQLEATDSHPLYLGQRFRINLDQLQSAKGKVDATYSAKNQQVTADNVQQQGNIRHQISLVASGTSKKNPRIHEYRVIRLTSQYMQKTSKPMPKGEVERPAGKQNGAIKHESRDSEKDSDRSALQSNTQAATQTSDSKMEGENSRPETKQDSAKKGSARQATEINRER